MPFSVRRGSYRSNILETVHVAAAERQTSQKKKQGKNRLGLHSMAP